MLQKKRKEKNNYEGGVAAELRKRAQVMMLQSNVAS